MCLVCRLYCHRSDLLLRSGFFFTPQAMGIAVEFCVHIVCTFSNSKSGSRLRRAQEALATTGSSVSQEGSHFIIDIPIWSAVIIIDNEKMLMKWTVLCWNWVSCHSCTCTQLLVTVPIVWIPNKNWIRWGWLQLYLLFAINTLCTQRSLACAGNNRATGILVGI